MYHFLKCASPTPFAPQGPDLVGQYSQTLKHTPTKKGLVTIKHFAWSCDIDVWNVGWPIREQ